MAHHKLPVLALLIVCDVSCVIAQPEILNIRQRQDSVGQYEKFEIDLSLKANYINVEEVALELLGEVPARQNTRARTRP